MGNERLGLRRCALHAALLVGVLDATAGAASSDGGPPVLIPQRYPAPAWIDARLPLRSVQNTPHVLLAYRTSHTRILRAGQPWLNVADHLPGASLVRAEPAGAGAVLTLFIAADRPYAVYHYRSEGTLVPVVDSQIGAAVRGERSLIFVRGSSVIERALDGTAEQVRQRFLSQEVVERVDAIGDAVLVLVQRRNNTRDVVVLGSNEPRLQDVQFGSATRDGWVVNHRGRSVLVGGDGQLQPWSHDRRADVIEVARPPLSLEVREASAVLAITAEGTLWRRTPWVVNVEGYDVHRALRGEVMHAHRLQVVRSVDGTTAIWRESESDPWRPLDGMATPWGSSAISANQFSLDGSNLVAHSPDNVRWYRGATPTVLVGRGVDAMRLSGSTLWWRSHANVWTQMRLDASAAQPNPDPHVVQHAGRTLRVRGGEALTLDGQPLPFRWPETMRGYFGVVVDGAYPVEGTSYVLLVVGRQSPHGGHFVFDRVLAVDLRDGSVGRVGPEGAQPLGFDSHANFRRWHTLDAAPRGLWMTSGRDLWLAPLNGAAALKTGTVDAPDGSPVRATVSPDRQRIASVQAGQVVVWDAERAAVVARTPKLRTPSWKWGPRGHALAIAGAGSSFAISEAGDQARLGCAVAAGGSQSPLLDVLPETGAALVCVDGRLAISQPNRCIQLPEISCYQVSLITWGATVL